MRRLAAALLALLPACGSEAPREPRATCGVTPATTLTGDGMGEARIGVAVASLAAVCPVLSDETAPGPEGLVTRVLRLDLGRDTLAAEVSEGRVWRIAVRSPAFRTADSIGVGTPLSRLLEVPGVRALTGEGAVFARLPTHCGLSFRLSEPATSAVETAEELCRMPARTHVSEVLVVGCRPGDESP